MRLSLSFLTLLTLAAAALASLAEADDSTWPQWRGPDRDGHSEGPRWPDDLSEANLRQIWRVELSPSYSGPIVSADTVFSTETSGNDMEVVRSFDRDSGSEIWRSSWKGGTTVPFFAKANGDWIRSTPAFDGEHLYAAGMRDVLVCLDAKTGSELWRIDFVAELGTPEPDFGFVSSPLIDESFLYVQAGASFIKVRKLDGHIVWRTLQDRGGMSGSAFSSPVMETLGGRKQLVVQTREKLAGIDVSDGRLLWEQPVKAFRGMNILTPTIHDDVIFTSTYGGRTTGYSVKHSEDQFEISEAWRYKAQGYMSSPIVIDGVAYHHLKSQRMMAVELATGRELWTSGRSFGKYMSFIARGKRFLALDQKGTLYLIRANPEKLEIIDQRTISSDETWAHLAAADNQLFVRELNALAAYEWTPNSY